MIDAGTDRAGGAIEDGVILTVTETMDSIDALKSAIADIDWHAATTGVTEFV